MEEHRTSMQHAIVTEDQQKQRQSHPTWHGNQIPGSGQECALGKLLLHSLLL